jgi:hypothetical protein
MITRRMFHTRLLAALAATGGALPRMGQAAAGDEARLWLNRLTFGSTPGDIEVFTALGAEAWLDHQLRSRPPIRRWTTVLQPPACASPIPPGRTNTAQAGPRPTNCAP